MGGDTWSGKIARGVRFFLPVISVISFAGVLALFATLSETEVEATIFKAQEGSGTSGQAFAGIGNTLIFIIPAIVGSFLIIYIIRSGKKKLLKYLFRGALTISGGVILSFFLYKMGEALSERVWYTYYVPSGMYELVSVPFVEGDMLWFLAFGLVTGYVLTSMIFSQGFTRKERNRALIALSGSMGAFMAVILPTWTVVFLLVGLAIWDIYAVFKGPIKQMVEMDIDGSMMVRWDPLGDDSEEFPFGNMTYDAGSWQLGIGDLVFYSMLGAHSLYYSVAYVRTEGFWMLPFFFVPVLIAILVGFTYTIYRLTRGDGTNILPGLPVPMFLGVGVFCLMMGAATLLF